MTVALHSEADEVLRRLPAGAWRALPTLAILGLVSGGAWGVTAWLWGDAPWVPLVVVALSTPAAGWAVGTLSAELFSIDRSRRREMIATGVFAAVPALCAGWSVFAAVAADAAGSPWLQIVAVAAALAALASGLLGVTGIAVGAVRTDVRLVTIARAAVVATVRRPLASLAVLLVGVAVGWWGVTAFAGLVFLAAPAALVVLVPAGWVSASAIGVALPPLAPYRPLRARRTGRTGTLKGTT